MVTAEFLWGPVDGDIRHLPDLRSPYFIPTPFDQANWRYVYELERGPYGFPLRNVNGHYRYRFKGLG